LCITSRIGGPSSIKKGISVEKVQTRYVKPADIVSGVNVVFPGMIKNWLNIGTVAPIIALPKNNPIMHPIS
jgi:hypothetical protein